jgi:hypothetical protein
MQCTADFHHHIADPRFPYPDGLFQHAAAFDAAVDMFDAHPSPSEPPIPRFLRSRQLLAAGLLRRLDDVHSVQRKRLKAYILPQLAPSRQWVRRGVGEALVMDTARAGLTQEEDGQGPIDPQEIFQQVPLFLAAITPFLFSRVLGARDGSLGAIMTKRGAAGGVMARTSSAGGASSGKSGTATPMRVRKASTRPQGASPKVRKVLRNTSSKT